MALGNKLRFIGFKEGKITLPDNTAFDVIDIKEQVALDLEVASAVNEAGAVNTSVDAHFKGGKLTVNQALFDAALIAALTGESVATEGATPNQINTLDLHAGTPFKYFKFEVKTERVETVDTGAEAAGDIHLVVYKCKLTSNIKPIMDSGKWVVVEFTAEAVKDSANAGKIATYVVNETPTDIT
jgi:hypothetical protein